MFPWQIYITARETAAKERSSSGPLPATSPRLLSFARWERRNGSQGQSRFRSQAHSGSLAQDFRARNIRCAHARGPPFPSSGPTSGSSPWKTCLLLDETARAQLSQFLLRAAEAAAEAVRPS